MTLEKLKEMLFNNIAQIKNIQQVETLYSDEYYSACAEYLMLESDSTSIPEKLRKIRELETEACQELIKKTMTLYTQSLGR